MSRIKAALDELRKSPWERELDETIRRMDGDLRRLFGDDVVDRVDAEIAAKKAA